MSTEKVVGDVMYVIRACWMRGWVPMTSDVAYIERISCTSHVISRIFPM